MKRSYDFLQTKLQVDDFINQLDLLSEKLFDVKGSFEDRLNSSLSFRYKEEFLTLCHENKIDLEAPKEAAKFIDKTKEEIKKIKVVELHIAFEPKESNVSAICSWFAGYLKERVIVDFKVDRGVVGGAQISLDGKFLDFSLREELNKKLQEGEIHRLIGGIR